MRTLSPDPSAKLVYLTAVYPPFCRNFAWCGFNADKSAFLFAEDRRTDVATALGKEAAGWNGEILAPWSGAAPGHDEQGGAKGQGKSKVAPPLINFARLPDDPSTPDVVSIGIHPFTSNSHVSAARSSHLHIHGLTARFSPCHAADAPDP